jgi:hypothetical protein
MNYFLYTFDSEFDFNKLMIGIKINKSNGFSKYNLYYLDKVPKDLFILVPPVRLIYSYKNNKFNQIKLPIYPIYDQTKQFIMFFKNLKKFIKEKINLNKKYINIIEKKEDLNLLKINLPNDFKINFNNETLSIEELKIDSELKGVINLSSIWENDLSYGITAYVSKFYYQPKIENVGIDFLDSEPIKKNIIKKVINDQKELSPIKPNLLISPSILMQTINKLKKL